MEAIFQSRPNWTLLYIEKAARLWSGFSFSIPLFHLSFSPIESHIPAR